MAIQQPGNTIDLCSWILPAGTPTCTVERNSATHLELAMLYAVTGLVIGILYIEPDHAESGQLCVNFQ